MRTKDIQPGEAYGHRVAPKEAVPPVRVVAVAPAGKLSWTVRFPDGELRKVRVAQLVCRWGDARRLQADEATAMAVAATDTVPFATWIFWWAMGHQSWGRVWTPDGVHGDVFHLVPSAAEQLRLDARLEALPEAPALSDGTICYSPTQLLPVVERAVRNSASRARLVAAELAGYERQFLARDRGRHSLPEINLVRGWLDLPAAEYPAELVRLCQEALDEVKAHGGDPAALWGRLEEQVGSLRALWPRGEGQPGPASPAALESQASKSTRGPIRSINFIEVRHRTESLVEADFGGDPAEDRLVLWSTEVVGHLDNGQTEVLGAAHSSLMPHEVDEGYVMDVLDALDGEHRAVGDFLVERWTEGSGGTFPTELGPWAGFLYVNGWAASPNIPEHMGTLAVRLAMVSCFEVLAKGAAALIMAPGLAGSVGIDPPEELDGYGVFDTQSRKSEDLFADLAMSSAAALNDPLEWDLYRSD